MHDNIKQVKTVASYILDYMNENTRLVIPNLGTFVKRDDGVVVFVEILRRDDGVLRGLIEADGINPIAASGIVDRFVFEMRRTIQERGYTEFTGFGTLTKGEDGVVTFEQLRTCVDESDKKKKHDVVVPLVERVESNNVEPIEAEPQHHTKVTYVKSRKKRGFDKFIVVAIVVALLAVGVIVYAVLQDRELIDRIYPQGEPQSALESTESVGESVKENN